MSHSKIFQISSNPIDRDDWRVPEDYYDNSDDFADYIGDRVEGEEERDEEIGHLADLVKDVFTPVGRGVLAYKGRTALLEFKVKWLEAIDRFTEGLTADNMSKEMRMYRLRSLTEETHLRSSFRVDIEEWTGGAPNALGELFVWAENELEEGDRIYVGAVTDYHY